MSRKIASNSKPDDSQVRLELRRARADGTTHLVFDPVELLERLPALIPRPRLNLIPYYRILAPLRERTRPADGPVDAAECRHTRSRLWAESMRRSLSLDVLACPRCRGRLALIALIEAASGRQHLVRRETVVPLF